MVQEERLRIQKFLCKQHAFLKKLKYFLFAIADFSVHGSCIAFLSFGKGREVIKLEQMHGNFNSESERADDGGERSSRDDCESCLSS